MIDVTMPTSATRQIQKLAPTLAIHASDPPGDFVFGA